MADPRASQAGAIATAYDHHKGYERQNWLEVVPVCDRDNALRAQAKRSKQGTHAAVLLRISVELIRAIDDESERESRSRNGQIEWVLRDRYRRQGLDIKEDRVPYIVAAA